MVVKGCPNVRWPRPPLPCRGTTQKVIKSVDGWSNDREVAIYTAGADQAELAKTGLTALAEWELRTRPNHNQS